MHIHFAATSAYYVTMNKKLFIIPLSIIGGLLAIILIVAAAIYFWPLRTTHLQTGVEKTVSYNESIKQSAHIVSDEKSSKVLDKCLSKTYTHGKKTAKAVVMFHGVTACPSQFDGLAKTFFDAGYNVYVPLTPHHGLTDKKQHGKVTANELVDYANQSITIGTGLGDELGVVGLSGGGMLATWASEYRPEVKRTLALSPFYEPAAAQAPKIQLPFLSVLYGFHILPDTFIVPADPDGAAFSYSALANYIIVRKNLKSSPDNLPLKSFSVITSDDDDQIDLPLAHSLPREIAAANPSMTFLETNLPADWKLGHDIVSLDNPEVAKRSSQLFELYFSSYEGRTADL